MCIESGRRLVLACWFVLFGVSSAASAEDSWNLRLSPLTPVIPQKSVIPHPEEDRPDLMQPEAPPLGGAVYDPARPGKPARSHDGLSPIRVAETDVLVIPLARSGSDR